MRAIIKKLLNKVMRPTLLNIEKSQIDTIMLLGKLHAERIKPCNNISSLWEVEFKVFSQFGEDGIIQYIISKIEIPKKIFIEFGVENYTESNTRFLLFNDNWQGLVMDGSETNINAIINSYYYWRYNLKALCKFITKNNINKIIKENIGEGDIGLLSIDIDGNDYWIWQQIEIISPRIVICEYNNCFGSKYAVTVPYDENFIRREKHYSDLYFGASLPALCVLAEKKGYSFIGSNSAGNNAFFIREDLSGPFKKYSASDGFVEAKFRESKGKDKRKNYLTGSDRIKEIAEMEVYNIETNKITKIRNLLLD